MWDFTKQVITHSPEETFALARDLGHGFRGGEVVALVGTLGSGKTTFTRGLVCGLGCPYYRKVNSPTYVLEQIYEGRVPIHHYDAYRLNEADELQGLGFEEHLGSERVLVIEWADRIEHYLPATRMVVEIEFAGGAASRSIRISGAGIPPTPSENR